MELSFFINLAHALFPWSEPRGRGRQQTRSHRIPGQRFERNTEAAGNISLRCGPRHGLERGPVPLDRHRVHLLASPTMACAWVLCSLRTWWLRLQAEQERDPTWWR